jgi:hypothetical protein
MAGLVPAIHVFLSWGRKNVDARAEASGSDAVLQTAVPGHDSVLWVRHAKKQNQEGNINGV